MVFYKFLSIYIFSRPKLRAKLKIWANTKMKIWKIVDVKTKLLLLLIKALKTFLILQQVQGLAIQAR